MLPDGPVLFTDFSNDVELFTSTGSHYTGWRPAVFRLLLTNLSRAVSSIVLSGSKFNGASQDGAYGDDFQDATNYPIVRFTNSVHRTSFLWPHPRSQHDGGRIFRTDLYTC